MASRTFALSPPLPSLPAALRETLAGAGKIALSGVFAAFILAALAATNGLALPVARYDLLLALCLAFQLLMLWTGLETADELKVICLFHALGLAMEIVKVNHGSWSYPGAAASKVLGVPLFSGFMYASVASFLCQAWRHLRIAVVGWPRPAAAIALGAAIYLNFLTNVFLPDVRLALFVAVLAAFRGTRLELTIDRTRRRLPLVAGFFLLGLAVWLTENVATFLGAWRYPNQHHGWQPVGVQKLSSWFLLVIVSLLIVTELKRMKQRRTRGGPAGRIR